MSSLVSIANESDTQLANLEAHRIRTMPVLVISPHNQCNCRCVMCDIWKIREAQELTPADLDRQLDSLKKLGVRWIVFSGGEPQRNPELATLARMLRQEGIRLTLLTAGMLLATEAELLTEVIDDVIVSLDGPPEVHDRIRRVPGAFQQLESGLTALRKSDPNIMISARCTVQRENHNALRATVETAKGQHLNSISFLAVDAHSIAFHHPQGWTTPVAARVGLNEREVEDLDTEVEMLIREKAEDLHSAFVAESPDKLRKIVRRFRESLGQSDPIAPRCNAPWVSTVVEANGDVRPCFFHPVVGNIHQQSLDEVVNGVEALRFRSQLDISSNTICKRCVCSLYISPNVEPPAGIKH